MRNKRQSDTYHDASGAWERLGGELAAAVGFMTRLPLPATQAAHARPLADASWAFPVAGLAIGLIAGAVMGIASALGVPAFAAALLALGASALTTGALHEDGLSDCFDGLWGGADKETRLTIMRDSRVGGYGALSLVIATGLKAACLAALIDGAGVEAGWLALVAAHMAGRGVLPGVMHLVQRAGETGLAAMAGRPDQVRAGVALAIGALALPILLGPGIGLVAIVLGGLVTAKFVFLARWKLGGYTGDVLGLIEQAVEITVLLCAAAAIS